MREVAFARLRTDEDSGFSLIELLVVMLIMTVIGGIVTAGVIGGMRTTAYGQDRVHATAAAQTGIERLSRELRAADPLLVAEPGRAEAAVRRGDELHHYIYQVEEDADGSFNLVERRRTFTDPTLFNAFWFDPLTATPDRVTERVLVWDLAGTEPFSYVNSAGDPTGVPASVRRITVSVERVVAPGRAPVQVETLVTLRNA
jgi:prepilin-type N-terminal cleavage/methylation domain-containing protein